MTQHDIFWRMAKAGTRAKKRHPDEYMRGRRETKKEWRKISLYIEELIQRWRELFSLLTVTEATSLCFLCFLLQTSTEVTSHRIALSAMNESEIVSAMSWINRVDTDRSCMKAWTTWSVFSSPSYNCHLKFGYCSVKTSSKFWMWPHFNNPPKSLTKATRLSRFGIEDPNAEHALRLPKKEFI